MKKKLKDITVMIPGKIKKHKKLKAVLLIFCGRRCICGKLVCVIIFLNDTKVHNS